MPSWETILAVVFAGLVLSVMPGPSMLYVLSRSAGQSRSAGFASALGLALGGISWALAAALGLAVIFQQLPIAFDILSIVGAAYLLFLGGRMILEKHEESGFHVEKMKRQSFVKIVWQGLLVEIFNPKTILFFMAFIPPFVDKARGDVALQLLILGALVPLTSIPSDLIVAYTGGTLAKTMKRNLMARRILAWVCGFLLIGVAASLFADL